MEQEARLTREVKELREMREHEWNREFSSLRTLIGA